MHVEIDQEPVSFDIALLQPLEGILRIVELSVNAGHKDGRYANTLKIFQVSRPQSQHRLYSTLVIRPSKGTGQLGVAEANYRLLQLRERFAVASVVEVSFVQAVVVLSFIGMEGYQPPTDFEDLVVLPANVVAVSQNGLGWLGPLHRAMDWTDGCIAVTDAEIEEIYSAVPDGTPVEIQR
jgi:hypothetical protein